MADRGSLTTEEQVDICSFGFIFSLFLLQTKMDLIRNRKLRKDVVKKALCRRQEVSSGGELIADRILIKAGAGTFSLQICCPTDHFSNQRRRKP
jgi:hypothetical protein